jgi:Flp pilus assembly protein TadG
MTCIRLANSHKARRGAIAVMTALTLVPLLGIAAIALEGGLLLENRRRTQAAADASALAAADDLYKNYGSNNGLDINNSAKTSALKNAAANGYTNDGVTSTVQVHIPPLSGGSIGQPGYAEVTVQLNQPRFFSAIWDSTPIAVTARSVARGRWGAINHAIILLDPTKQGSLASTGNGAVSVTGASIVVDSNSAQAATASGNGVVSAPEFDITGSPGEGTVGNGSFSGTLKSGQKPLPDPLSYLPAPDPNKLQLQQSGPLQISGPQIVTLQPGVYKGGISISGPSTVTLMPGIYYLDGGGFSSTGQAIITGLGVMLYNAPTTSTDTIKIAGQGLITITPPTSGVYQGISLFQDRTSTAPLSITGNGSLNMTGTFYAAKATLNIAGNGVQNTIGSQYISYDLSLAGNGAINVIWNANLTARGRNIGLIE